MKDNRWNAVALLILRVSQLVLVVIALGLTAYFTATYTARWYLAFTLAAVCLSVCWIALTLGLFFANELLPLAALLGDILLAILYIVSIATIGDYNSDSIAGNCTFFTYSIWTGLDYYEFEDCGKLRGLFGILVLVMLTFIGAIIWDSIVLYQNRNGRPGSDQVVPQNVMYGGVSQMAATGGKPMVGAADGGDAGGYYGPQTFLPQYQPTNSPIYPAQIASPAISYNPHMPPPPLSPTMPQQAAMMQHQNQQQQQQLHQVQQQQQRQYQQQSQHHQQQQNQGPLPQELVGAN